MIVPERVKEKWDVVSEPSLVQIDKLKKELQSEKDKVATMELLVASLLSRVGDLEKRIA